MIHNVRRLHNQLSDRVNWYRKWHQWKHHHKVHWAVLGVYVLSLISFFSVFITNTPKSYASEEIAMTRISGSDPTLATYTSPPAGDSGYISTLYQFDNDKTYSVESYAVDQRCWGTGAAAAGGGHAKIELSTDGSTWSGSWVTWNDAAITSPNCFFPTFGNTVTITPTPGPSNGPPGAPTPAKYARISTVSELGLDGTLNTQLTNFHLYGTQAGATVTINSPTSESTYNTSTTPQTVSGTATTTSGTVSSITATVNGGSVTPTNGGLGTSSATFSLSTGALNSGNNTVVVTAVDSLSNSTSDTLTIHYNNSPPTATITSPTSNPTYCTASSSQALGGSASDDVSVSSVATSPSSTVTGTTSWSTSAISLSAGANVIGVTATDGNGNTGSDSITITRDNTNPTATIASPSSNPTYVTSTSTTSLGGSADDGSGCGIDHVSWSNDRGGSGTATGTTSWSVGTVNLLTGANVITVTAYDLANNSANDTITITLDSTIPTVAISSPVANCVSSSGNSDRYYTTSATQVVSGSAADDNTVSSVTTSPSSTVTGTTSWSSSAISLTADADTTITATSHDNANNDSTPGSIIVFRDNTNPTVSIGSATTSTSASYTLSGTSSDTGGSGVTSVTSSGLTITGTTSWSTTVTLASGANNFSVGATDCAGNNASAATITVTYTPASSGDSGSGDSGSGSGDTGGSGSTVGDASSICKGQESTVTKDETKLKLTKPSATGITFLTGFGTLASATQALTWTKDSSLTGTVKFYLSTNSGTSYGTTAQNNSETTQASALTWTWTVPTSTKSTTNRMCVIHSSGSTQDYYDTGDNDFEIHANSKPSVSI